MLLLIGLHWMMSRTAQNWLAGVECMRKKRASVE